MTFLLKIGLSEGDRSPKRLRPNPYSQSINTVHYRRRDSPFDVSGKAEGNKGLSGAVTDTVLSKHTASLITIRKSLELYGE